MNKSIFLLLAIIFLFYNCETTHSSRKLILNDSMHTFQLEYILLFFWLNFIIKVCGMKNIKFFFVLNFLHFYLSMSTRVKKKKRVRQFVCMSVHEQTGSLLGNAQIA